MLWFAGLAAAGGMAGANGTTLERFAAVDLSSVASMSVAFSSRR